MGIAQGCATRGAMSEQDEIESIGEMRTLGREGEETRKEEDGRSIETWTAGLSERETLKRPCEQAVPETGIVDDGRTDAARRWRPGDTILGRYVVERELGQGGMGVVYGCLDKVGGVHVAVKCLPPELGHNTVEMEEVRENFELVYKLGHPNIAGVRMLERDGRGEYYLVMEEAEGENLRRWIREKRKTGGISLAEAVAVLRQVASALDYAHGEKVVHRDVKPGNVMIDGRGRVKVLDFGLAEQIRTSLSRASQAYRGTSGTGPYMSPEQWRGRQQDGKTDQYALGVMAYEMLAGHLPFENSDISVLKDAVLHDVPDSIPGLPPHAMAALRRAMAKRAEERFATCREFVDALAGSNEKRGVPGGTRWGWIVALLLAAVVVGGGIWTAALWQENVAARQRETARLAAEEAARQSDADHLEAEEAARQAEAARIAEEEEEARQREEAEKVRLLQESEEQERQEKMKAAREEAINARNSADRMAALVAETLRFRGIVDDIADRLGKAHQQRRAVEDRLASLSAQLKQCWEGKNDGATAVSAAAWESVLKQVEESFRDEDAKLRNMRKRFGVQHQAIKTSVIGNLHLQVAMNILSGGLEEYREGIRGLEAADRLYRDGDLKHAEERWRSAATSFGKAMNLLHERMEGAAGEGLWNDTGFEGKPWYRVYAEQGNAFAQDNLGWMYEYGCNVPQSDIEAVKWYRKAAEQGNAEAQMHLGWMYEIGRGVVKSREEAAKWYRKAAEQGNVRAQTYLGELLEDEFGSEEAVEWYQKAADKGSVGAQGRLALLYLDGRMVEKNDAEALKWIRKMAEQGDDGGEWKLGWMYENGVGTPRNLAEAVKWYQKAAAQGHEGAQKALQELGQ